MYLLDKYNLCLSCGSIRNLLFSITKNHLVKQVITLRIQNDSIQRQIMPNPRDYANVNAISNQLISRKELNLVRGWASMVPYCTLDYLPHHA